MMSDRCLNISFLKGMEDPNLLDRFIMRAGAADGLGDADAPSDDYICKSEVHAAAGDPRYARLFSAVAAPDCYKFIRSYLISRGLVHAARPGDEKSVEPEMPAGSVLWLSQQYLLGLYDAEHVADLVGAYHYAYGVPFEEIVGRRIHLAGEKKLLPKFESALGGLTDAQILNLLTRFDDFSDFAKREASLVLLATLRKRSAKSEEAAEAVADILERNEDFLFENVDREDEEDEISFFRSMTDITSIWDKIKEESNPLRKFTSEYPIDKSLGARIAHGLKHIGILNKKSVDVLGDIMEDDDYDVYTRAKIAWVLGVADYSDTSARQLAADRLVEFLDDIEMGEWRSQRTSRIAFEAVIALGQIGICKTDKNDVCDVLAYFITDVSQPFLRLAAAASFGFLGTQQRPHSHASVRIKRILYDALKDEEFLSEAVAKAINRIERREIRSTDVIRREWCIPPPRHPGARPASGQPEWL